MKLPYLLSLCILLIGSATASSQNMSCCGSVVADTMDTDTIQTDFIQLVIDAAIAMRNAAATGDSSALKQSALEFKKSKVVNFNNLHCKDDTLHSMNGHLVFDEAFADSLANGIDVYRHADAMNRSATHRGRTADGSIFTRTCFVKAKKSTKYTFTSGEHQELAVVAEAGGLITMKVHVTNRAGLNQWHNDTIDTKKGRPQRKTSFDLPKTPPSLVELEVINCTNRDISFVVISN